MNLRLATIFALSTNMALAEPQNLPAFDFNSLGSSNCDQIININNPDLSPAETTFYHRTTIIGCEFFKQDLGDGHFLSQQIEMLQIEMLAYLAENNIEEELAIDGVLGPLTAGAFVDYALSLNISDVFNPNKINNWGINGAYINRFIKELESHSPDDIQVARDWALLNSNEGNENALKEDQTRPTIPRPNNLGIPTCEDAYRNINFDGACYYEANFTEPTIFDITKSNQNFSI